VGKVGEVEESRKKIRNWAWQVFGVC
jgi:hypothetical protein